MTLQGIVTRNGVRQPGYRDSPVKLELMPSTPAFTAEKVRIFIGSEPEQHRGERVLLWSIFKHRDERRHYEIFVMKDLRGFDRRNWKTGFTGYRYAIPELAGFEGLAIYNDVDQIYLRDPAALIAEDMDGAGVLALESRDTSVMLLNCELLADRWNLEAVTSVPQRSIHTHMLKRVRANMLISDLPVHWNARDHEYSGEADSLLHYTTLHKQPWRPFPQRLKYQNNPQAMPWFELEEEADRRGFAPHWKAGPDQSYTQMQDFFKVANQE